MSNFDNILEDEHNKFVNSDDYNKMIQERVEYANYHKFDGIAPDGFVLIPIEVLEKLKEFDIWKEWKYNPELLTQMSKDFLKNQ
jgi:hypothetical protein